MSGGTCCQLGRWARRLLDTHYSDPEFFSILTAAGGWEGTAGGGAVDGRGQARCASARCLRCVRGRWEAVLLELATSLLQHRIQPPMASTPGSPARDTKLLARHTMTGPAEVRARSVHASADAASCLPGKQNWADVVPPSVVAERWHLRTAADIVATRATHMRCPPAAPAASTDPLAPDTVA